jgi:hypothetical protein
MLVSKDIRLKVAESKSRDAGRGKARISDAAMNALDVLAGDVIQVKGKRTTAAIAWPAYQVDQDQATIRIDGLIRRNADVKLGEYVKVSKAHVNEARHATLAPRDMHLNVDADFVNFVKSRLFETPLLKGDIVFVVVLGSAIPFHVKETQPKGFVNLTQSTELTVLRRPELGPEHKALNRFNWLETLEQGLSADSTRFTIPTIIDAEQETPVIEKAKTMARNSEQPITTYVEFWEKRGKIGTFPWAVVTSTGELTYVYKPDNLPQNLAEGTSSFRRIRSTSNNIDYLELLVSTLRDHEKQLNDLTSTFGNMMGRLADLIRSLQEKNS